jgi:hypothetical protein
VSDNQHACQLLHSILTQVRWALGRDRRAVSEWPFEQAAFEQRTLTLSPGELTVASADEHLMA